MNQKTNSKDEFIQVLDMETDQKLPPELLTVIMTFIHFEELSPKESWEDCLNEDGTPKPCQTNLCINCRISMAFGEEQWKTYFCSGTCWETFNSSIPSWELN